MYLAGSLASQITATVPTQQHYAIYSVAPDINAPCYLILGVIISNILDKVCFPLSVQNDKWFANNCDSPLSMPMGKRCSCCQGPFYYSNPKETILQTAWLQDDICVFINASFPLHRSTQNEI